MIPGMVRPYRPQDRAGVFKIGGDTAFFGAPIEIYMEDRRFFLDSFYAYYTDFEPEHAWVVDVDGQVAGFLTGCTDPLYQKRVMKREIMPRVWVRALTGYYRIGPKARRYIGRMIGEQWNRNFCQIDEGAFPAHLHINVDEAFRGQGFGRKLIQTYLNQLSELGIGGVHLMTSNMNTAACSLYEKMGFRLVDARPSNMWAGLIDRPFESRAYARVVAPVS